MPPTAQLLLLSTGGFFLTGLLCGCWKHSHICCGADNAGPAYVEVPYRAGFMYAFAMLVLERFVIASQLPDSVELAAVVVQVACFAFPIFTYVVHGVLQDTDNQFKPPHLLGRLVLPPAVVTASMLAIAAADIGGFWVLLWGATLA